MSSTESSSQSNRNYLKLEEYELIAKKILNASFPKISGWIFKDNDKFGEIVSAVIQGDMHWDGRGSLVGYRKQRVVWCVRSMLNKEKKKPVSLNFNITDSMELLETIPDVIGPDLVEFNDKLEVLRSKIEKSPVLTEKEKECMHLYFSNNELAIISENLGVSKECVKSTIRRGLHKIGKTE
jgi:hypothetical protein